ncbi:MAG: pilus assembly protein TadG-related protein [Eubacterium sp.]
MSISKPKKKDRQKRENGAIALISAFLITLLVCFAAFVIDYGLYYYQSAKLQNAVDAAGTAVAANIGSTDTSLESIALSYLQKNGIDVQDKYKDSVDVKIERKGVLDSETLNENEYITTGYIKLTVSIDDDAVLANILGINTWHLKKSSFVKCDANYVEMPRALKYTLFAGSVSGSDADPALEIQGRTGDVTNYIISTLEGVINGINEKIVQPIIGIFGGTPNLTDLVHINLSEAITNGDVHSNSNIEIGVQALNAARAKDQDYTGTETNDEAYEETILEDDNDYDDYGQVTYTAVDSIEFTNTSRDTSTHVYVQNQHYLEQTQNALTILNEMNLNSISSTSQLQSEYEEKATHYLENKNTITAAQKQDIINQSANLTFNEDGTISLNNQAMIVYDVSQDEATQMLNIVESQTLSGVVEEFNTVGTDKLYSSDSTLLFQNVADKASSGGIKYSIKISHEDSEGNALPDIGVSVNGTQVNRDIGKTGISVSSDNSATITGAKFALARTFQENLGEDGYIAVPNMKPYFVRQVNQSIRNSTKTKEELGDSEATGSKTVKAAVKDMSDDLTDILDKTSYEDNTYKDTSTYTNKDTTLLFSKYKETKNSGLAKLTGDAHTTFMGESLYNSNGVLKTPSDFINNFAKENIKPDSLGESNYSVGAVKEYYNNEIANNDSTTKDKYATVYGNDAVQKKKDELNGKYASLFETKKAQVDATDVSESDLPTLPDRKKVFLGPDMSDFSSLGIVGDTTAYAIREQFNSYMTFGLSTINGTNVDITMPTYTAVSSSSITVNMSGGATWGDGSTGDRTFTSTSGYPELSNNCYYPSGRSHNGQNSLYVKSGNSFCSIGDITVKEDWLGRGGNLDVGQENGSNATLVVFGSISTEDDVQVRSNSVIYVTGNISCYNLLVESGAKIYCSGNISVSNNADIYDNAIISAKGNFSTKNITVRSNSCVNAYGSVTISGTTYNDNSASYIKASSITFSAGNTNNITIYGNLMSMGDIYINPRVYLNGTIKCKGDLTLNGDKNWNSLNSYGKIYVTGNLLSNYTMELQNSELYVCGNIDGANNSSSDSDAYNIFHIVGADKVYIGGYVGTNSSKERHIWIEGSGGAVFSVYGFVKTSSITYDRYPFKNLKEFCNSQSNSTVYIGDGRLTDSILNTTVTISFPNTFQNYGTLYCYDELQLTGSAKMILNGTGSSLFDRPVSVSSGDTTVSGGHTLYCTDAASMANLIVSDNSRAVFKSTFSSSGTISASGSSRIYCPYSLNASALNINNNSRLVCKEEITVNSINVSGNSKVWGYKTVESGDVTIASDSADTPSEVYCGEGSKIRSGAKLIISGYFCTPSQSLDGQALYNLDTLNVGSYGKFICPEDVTVSNVLSVDAGVTSELGILYVEGKTTFTGSTINNADKMYLMGGLSYSGSSDTACGFNLNSSSDTFIGTNVDGGIGTLELTGYYLGQGNMYIENNLVVNGYYSGSSSDYVANRAEAFIISNGNTYVSGNVTLSDGRRAFYISTNSSLSCRNLSLGSAIYNLGKLIIFDNLDFRNDFPNCEFSDKKEYDSVANLKKGFSIRNGGKETDKVTDAVLYIGGSNGFTVGGSLQNWGKIYCNGGVNVQGYYSSSSAPAADIAFLNQDGAIAHFGGNVFLNSNAMLNAVDAIFATDGNLKFGYSLYNCGQFIVTGTITNDEQTNETVNNRSYRDSSSTSIRNGSYNITSDLSSSTYPNSLLYCGGDLKLGTSESAGNAGSFINFGTTYVGGDLLGYTNADNSYYRTALWMFNNTKTFVGGNVFAGGGVVVGNDSIFMCGGDYQSKRSTKLNAECGTDSDVGKACYTYFDDQKDSKDKTLSSAYIYVGGNMLVNTLGKTVRASSITTVPKNSSRDMDIYSNTNIYVSGSVYANCKIYMKENVTMLVEGNKSISDGSTLNTILNSIENGTVKATIQSLLDGTDYKFFIYQCLDENICSKLAVNGSMFVRDTCKIRDMAKNYVYGNFKCNDYVEIGKSLYDDDRDESQATEAIYREEGESKVKYNFSNAGYMYVDGDFNSLGYTKVYASTTLRVKDDFVSNKYLTLRHDAKIYVGKKLKALTSIEGGSYSEFHVAGSMQAVGSFIKIRDCTTAVVGGNMTALSYIELGKYGDYTREVTKNSDGTYTVNESDFHGVTEGTESEYNGDEGEESGGSTDAGDDSSPEEAITDTTTIDTEQELANDTSDLAKGGQFYVGKTLASYTSYIKEFAYSRVAVGEYVFTPKYLTLRHNSDMWVMPETFDNETFVKKQYVSQSDGTLLGDIIDKLRELGYNIQQTFTPKNGSVYTLGELTLNKNASLMGTYDTIVLGQCVLRQDTLIYLGHNFECSAPSANISWDSITGNTSVVGFDSYGTASNSDKKTTFPVVIYANNSIKISTTMDMKLTYLVSNLGNVELYDIYSKSENAENNAKQLPNAVASYYGDIKYFSMYGKIGALFYAPNGNLNIDGYYTEIWGCGLGDTVDVNSYYFAMHRFTNWRTMNLEIAESGSVYLVSESEYKKAQDNVEDIYMYDRDTAIRDMSNGANLFFNFSDEE